MGLKSVLMRTVALLCRLAALMGLWLLVFGPQASMAQSPGKRVALLVGVGQYAHFANNSQLDGPANDAEALRDVLVRRWGYKSADVKVLINAQASRAAILSELAGLQRRSSPGDEVLVFFSGHGTSALDSTNALPVPHGSGAFIPADFNPGSPDPIKGVIVGRTDLVPIFKALEDGQRSIWVISDSCYSGRQVRSVLKLSGAELPARMIPLVLSSREGVAQRGDLKLADQAPTVDPYPYKATAFLSAAAEGERAIDIPARFVKSFPTFDGKAHGAMTDALLRVLEGQIPGDLNGDGMLSLAEVHRAIADFMGTRAYGQTPQRLPAVAEDAHALGKRPVLSARNVAMPARKAAVIDPLKVRLDGVPGAVERAIGGIPDVRLTQANEFADIQVRGWQGRLIVLSASGDLLAGMPMEDTARAMAQVRQLAWFKRLRTLAELNRRGALEMEVDPAQYGGNFVVGKKISFVVRPDRDSTLVLLNVNSDGKVTVLYPFQPIEDRPLPSGQARFIPGDAEPLRIEVREPVGMDLQLAFAFDEPPPGLVQLHRLQDVDPGDERLTVLERAIEAGSGKFTFATGSLRTLKP